MCKTRANFPLRPLVKSGFHCIDFHELGTRCMASHGNLSYRTSIHSCHSVKYTTGPNFTKLERAQQYLADNSCTGVAVNLVNCSIADTTSRIDRQRQTRAER